MFRYMAVDGRRREKGLGSCADVSLADARIKAAECRQMLRDGLDPLDAPKRPLQVVNTTASTAIKNPHTGPRRQRRTASKGEQTRIAVLDAALECLGILPYPEVTIAVVADRAGISKGGVQYHFASRRELLGEAVNRLFERRLEAYKNDLDNVPSDVPITDYIIDNHWKHLSESEFQIYQELLVSSRSNPELRALLVHRYKAFMREWHHLSLASFGWDRAQPEVSNLGHIAQYLMDGMAYGWFAGQLNPDDVGPLLDFVKSLMRQGVRGTSTSRNSRTTSTSSPALRPRRR